jgi:hypothetical protein
MEELYLNIVKGMYNIPLASLILNRGKLKAFSLRSGTRQGCPVLLLLFNIVLAVLARGTRQENKIKGIPIGKDEIKYY